MYRLRFYMALVAVACVFYAGGASAPVASAADIPSVNDNLTNAGGGAGYAPITGGSPLAALAQAVGSVIGVFFTLVGVIFLGFMIYAGWLWLTAGGNDEQVSRAKTLIRQVIIGLIIAIAAYAITYFVLQQLAPFNENLRGFR